MNIIPKRCTYAACIFKRRPGVVYQRVECISFGFTGTLYLTVPEGILECRFYSSANAVCENKVWWIRVHDEQVNFTIASTIHIEKYRYDITTT